MRRRSVAFGDSAYHLQTYSGNPEHLSDLHLWSLPSDPAFPQLAPLASLTRQALVLRSSPPSHHMLLPRSEPLLLTTCPFLTSTPPQQSCFHGSSTKQVPTVAPHCDGC